MMILKALSFPFLSYLFINLFLLSALKQLKPVDCRKEFSSFNYHKKQPERINLFKITSLFGGATNDKANDKSDSPIKKLKKHRNVKDIAKKSVSSNFKKKNDIILPVVKKSPEEILKKQQSLSFAIEMVSMGIYMLASRAIFKWNFNDKNTIMFSRMVFAFYLIFSQLLKLYLKHTVNTINDESLIDLTQDSLLTNQLLNKMSDISGESSTVGGITNLLSGLLGGTNTNPNATKVQKSTTISIKDYDLKEINKLFGGVIFEILMVSYMHLVNKSGKQLIFIPLMGITNKLKSPILQLHLFKFKSFGLWERPFKSKFGFPPSVPTVLAPPEPTVPTVTETPIITDLGEGGEVIEESNNISATLETETEEIVIDLDTKKGKAKKSSIAYSTSTSTSTVSSTVGTEESDSKDNSEHKEKVVKKSKKAHRKRTIENVIDDFKI